MQKYAIFSLLVLTAMAAKPTSIEVAALHLERILADDELVHGYFECLMDRGPCTPGGKDIKTILPDAFLNDCSLCSEIQKDTVKKIVKYAVASKPDYFKEIERKYDPEGAFRARQEARSSDE